MPYFKVKRSHTMVFGLKGTGKSNFLQWLLDEHPELAAHIVADVCEEHEALNQYLPKHRTGDKIVAEIDGMTQKLVVNNKRDRRPEVIVWEEVNRICPSRKPLPPNIGELVDKNRHYDIGIIGIARRPAQVNSDMVELADNLIIFRLTGANDYRRLEDIKVGLGDAARELDDYNYLHVYPDRSYDVKSPVKEMNTTGEL